MPHQSPARRRFRALLRRPEEAINLAEAAQCIAWEDEGSRTPEDVQRRLDILAGVMQQRLDNTTNPHAIIAELNHYLFDELGFRGNTWDYTDPMNSFLDRVLATRAGLPITLSVVYMELGWRLGLALAGLALPGHFLVQYSEPGYAIFIDPFERGRFWSFAECEARVTATYGNVAPSLMQQLMTPPTKRAILARMLQNLKASYAEREDWARALAAVERILLIDRGNLHEIRDRGVLRARLGQLHLALQDLDHYARHAPRASDLPVLRRQAMVLAEYLRAGN